jgi:hypothetical protein
MSRDTNKYKYKKKGDINRRNIKKKSEKERLVMGSREEKTPKCKECGKFFESERALHIHYTKAHNKGYA